MEHAFLSTKRISQLPVEHLTSAPLGTQFVEVGTYLDFFSPKKNREKGLINNKQQVGPFYSSSSTAFNFGEKYIQSVQWQWECLITV